MNSFCGYFFVAGVYVGGYTNLFGKLIISSLVLYIANPDTFNLNRFYPLCQTTYKLTYPYLSKIYSFSYRNKNVLVKDEELKITVLPSPVKLPPLPNAPFSNAPLPNTPLPNTPI